MQIGRHWGRAFFEFRLQSSARRHRKYCSTSPPLDCFSQLHHQSPLVHSLHFRNRSNLSFDNLFLYNIQYAHTHPCAITSLLGIYTPVRHTWSTILRKRKGYNVTCEHISLNFLEIFFNFFWFPRTRAVPFWIEIGIVASNASKNAKRLVLRKNPAKHKSLDLGEDEIMINKIIWKFPLNKKLKKSSVNS